MDCHVTRKYERKNMFITVKNFCLPLLSLLVLSFDMAWSVVIFFCYQPRRFACLQIHIPHNNSLKCPTLSFIQTQKTATMINKFIGHLQSCSIFLSDPELDGTQRIALLQQKLQELRKTYMNVKAELACIDRRRKKLRRREREGEIPKIIKN